MSAHTPGPWMWATSNSWRRLGAEHGPDGGVMYPTTQRDGHPDVCFPNGGFDGPDARLIAAAPELLQALIACAERLCIHMIHTEDLIAHMQAHKAIQKATGDAS